MTNYTVSWAIELDADTPMEAAFLAQQIHRDPNSLATNYLVSSESEDVAVDLQGGTVDEQERDESEPVLPFGWVQMGNVGVDSGQLLITDPCYIDSQWTQEEFFPSYPVLTLNEKGRQRFPVLRTGGTSDDWTWQCFRDGSSNYGTPLEDLGGMNINTAREEGLLEEVPQPDKPTPTSYSYNGCCEGTLHDPHYQQLQYQMGHDGVGVAFSSGYGDGYYPVFGRVNEDGRIVEVRIVMA